MEKRIYKKEEVVVFCKTADEYGGLSNMAPGFPIEVNNIQIRTSEALYQACRFPRLPEVQKIIVEQKSPMAAKMKSKSNRKQTRMDWDNVRISIMRWCLRIKLMQNWEKFRALLLSTGNKPIVEMSKKDDFWGAKTTDNDTLTGCNVLGRLLMEVREEVKEKGIKPYECIEPPIISDFLLYGEAIGVVKKNIDKGLMSSTELRKATIKEFDKQITLNDLLKQEDN